MRKRNRVAGGGKILAATSFLFLIGCVFTLLLLCSCSSETKVEPAEEIPVEIERLYVNDKGYDSGDIVIVGVNGKASIYEFVNGNPIMVSEGIEHMEAGCPYAIWVNPDTGEETIFGIMINGTWNVTEDEFDKLPIEWQSYIVQKFNLNK